MCKIVERIKKSRMHATTMDNVAQGENQCNSRQQSRFSDDVLANANVDAIILPAHSPVAIVLLLQGSNTYIGPGTATGRRQRLPCPSPSPSFLFLFLVPLSPNAIIVIDFAQFPMCTRPSRRCSSGSASFLGVAAA